MVSKIIAIACALLLAASAAANNFQSYQRQNEELTKQILNHAERCYLEIGRAWFGRDLPPLPEKCTITYTIGRAGLSSGETVWARPGMQDIQMRVNGSYERLMIDTIPHEVTHLVLRMGLGHELPRWMDEGACTSTESDSFITWHENKLIEYLRENRIPPLNVTLAMTQYPEDALPFYSQSVSLCRFLIGSHGHEKFLDLARTFRANGSWTLSFRELYGYESLPQLQDAWMDWVVAGSPDIQRASKPIPMSQAPYRPGSAYVSAEQCANGQCEIQQPQYRQTYPPQYRQVQPTYPSPTPSPTPSPSQQQPVGCDCDPEEMAQTVMEKIKNDDSLREYLRGPMGLEGPAGVDGKRGLTGPVGPPGPGLTAEQLASMKGEIKDDVLAAMEDRCRGHGAEQMENLKGQILAELEGRFGKESPVDYDFIVDRVLEKLEYHEPVPDSGQEPPKQLPPRRQRILYFTSNACTACEELDRKVDQYKAMGLPITIITLQQRDTEVYQVPQVFVPETGKSVIGMRDVDLFFVDYLKEGN